jgi:hypothetical protein
MKRITFRFTLYKTKKLKRGCEVAPNKESLDCLILRDGLGGRCASENIENKTYSKL